MDRFYLNVCIKLKTIIKQNREQEFNVKKVQTVERSVQAEDNMVVLQYRRELVRICGLHAAPKIAVNPDEGKEKKIPTPIVSHMKAVANVAANN